MQSPALRAFTADLDDGPYRIGVIDGKWDLHGNIEDDWPHVTFKICAANRDGSPKHYYVRLNLEGYPRQGPTGAFWDIENNGPLPAARWPKGGGPVGKVFRPTWQQGRMLYHPLDRGSAEASGHPQSWPRQYPSEMWSDKKTIVDYLQMVFRLLNAREYQGV